MQLGSLSLPTPEAALSVGNVSKTFVGTRALDDVSFDVKPGEVHALLGGNGSGKSTLIKILAGVYRADPGGRVALSGRSVAVEDISPALAREIGLRFVHQDPAVFQTMTVAENVGLVNGFPATGSRVRWRNLRDRTRALLDRFDIRADPDQPMSSLGYATQTMVAVARALEDDGDGLAVLVLDEPTAALPRHEVEALLDAVRACTAAGQTIIYVSHRIDEVLSVADAVTVLRDGAEVVTRSAEGLTESDLVKHIVGRSLTPRSPEAPQEGGREAVLQVRGLRGGPLRDVTFSAARGEVVGIAGLLGSGRTEILRSIFGAFALEAGEIELGGAAVRATSPAQAMALGIGYVSEDRALEAAFLEMSVRENLSVAHLADYRQGPRFRHDRERRDALEDIGRLGIRAAGDVAPLSSLSGGNQQKVILARWLRRRPRLLLLDEPTQGVDVGARADVYAIVEAAVREGLTALIASSDLDELAQVCDRVLILRDGRIATQLRAPDVRADHIAELVYAAKETTP